MTSELRPAVEVTDADREAAAVYWGNDNPPLELRAAFARHRIAERERIVGQIVAWLLSDESRLDYEASGSTEFFGWWSADWIEANFGGRATE